MSESEFSVERKQVEPLLVASVRMTGNYSDCGKGFGMVARKFGRYLCGKPMMLCHDSEYRDGDANFEVAMPIRKGTSKDEIEVKELEGGECLALIHRGPYDELKRSYEQIFNFAKENDLEYQIPTREVYLKGPGMIFRGNPKKYLTEIQLFLK